MSHFASGIHIDDTQKQILCSCGATFFAAHRVPGESAEEQIQRHIAAANGGSEQ